MITAFTHRYLYLRIILVVLITLALACNFPGLGGDQPEPESPAPTAESIPSQPPQPTIFPEGPQATIAPPPGSIGDVYYVSPSGDDSNPGSLSQPWRSIQKAADTLTSGETVYIREGAYNEQVRVVNTVTIDGSGIPIDEWGGLVEIFGLIFIRVSGFRIINSTSAGILVDESAEVMIDGNTIYNTVSSGIGVWSSSGVIIDGNEVELANNDGEQENITVAGTDNFQVRYNHVHHGGPGSLGGEGIDAKDGATNGKVYGNHVHHLTRVGIYVDAWDKHTYNIDVFGNLVHDIADEGFMLSSEAGGLLQNVRIFNNIAYHNKYNGLAISGCCSDLAREHPMSNIMIINNTFYDNGWDEWGGGIYAENPDAEAVLIRNNIVSQNLSFQILLEGGPLSEYTVDHNLVHGFRGEGGELYGDAYIEGDPLFVDPGAGDFHLQSGSPAIGQGSCDTAPHDDYDGDPRCKASDACDIGADETVESSVYIPLVLRS